MKDLSTVTYERAVGELAIDNSNNKEKSKSGLDKEEYDLRMCRLAHVLHSDIDATSTASSTESLKRFWPVTDAGYPLPGALLPFNRIIAYYGNFYSKGMGILGEYPAEEMFSKHFKEADIKNPDGNPQTEVYLSANYGDDILVEKLVDIVASSSSELKGESYEDGVSNTGKV